VKERNLRLNLQVEVAMQDSETVCLKLELKGKYWIFFCNLYSDYYIMDGATTHSAK
jgi:hypothetical protein